MATEQQLAALAKGRRKRTKSASVPLWLMQLTNLDDSKIDMLARALGKFPDNPTGVNKRIARNKVMRYLQSRVAKEGYKPVVKFIHTVVPKIKTVPNNVFETEDGKVLFQQIQLGLSEEHPDWSIETVKRRAVVEMGKLYNYNPIPSTSLSLTSHISNIKYAMRLVKQNFDFNSLKEYQQKIIAPYMNDDKTSIDYEKVVDYVPLTKQFKLDNTKFVDDLLEIHNLTRESAEPFFKKVSQADIEDLDVDTKNGVCFDVHSQVISNAAWKFNPERIGDQNWFHKNLVHPKLCKCGGMQELIIQDYEYFTKKWECLKCKRRHIQQMPFIAMNTKDHIRKYQGRIIAPTKIKAKKQSLKKYYYWTNPHTETIKTTEAVFHETDVRVEEIPSYLHRFKELHHIPTAHLFSEVVKERCDCQNGKLYSPLPIMFSRLLRNQYIPKGSTHVMRKGKWVKVCKHVQHYNEQYKCQQCNNGWITKTVYKPLPDSYEPSYYVNRLDNPSTTTIADLYMKREFLRESRDLISNENEHQKIATMVNTFIDEFKIGVKPLDSNSPTFKSDFNNIWQKVFDAIKLNIRNNRVPISSRDMADMKGFKGDKDNLTRSFYKFTASLGNITNYRFINKGVFGKVHMRTKDNENRVKYLKHLSPVIRWYEQKVKDWKGNEALKPLDYLKESCIDIDGKLLRLKTVLPIKRVVLEGLYTKQNLDGVDCSQIIQQVHDDSFTKSELEIIGQDLAKSGDISYIYRLEFFKASKIKQMNDLVFKMAVAGVSSYDVYSEDKIEEKKTFFNGTFDIDNSARFEGIGVVLDEQEHLIDIREGGDYFIALVPRYCDNIEIDKEIEDCSNQNQGN